ncbi:MAG: ATP-binding cassette domain-containing protein [Sandaracinaceae bacterium]|nr:ATP-binding cassette domain-containing protein [Sandaracinaceae bacterium]
MSIRDWSWPADRIGEALIELARAGGLPLASGVELGRPPPGRGPLDDFEWARLAVEKLGVEGELLDGSYRDLEELVGSIGPALLPLPLEDSREVRYLALLPRRGARPRLVAPDGVVHSTSARELAQALSRRLYEALEKRGLVQLLEDAGIAPARRERVLRDIAADRFGAATMGPFLVLRPHPSAGIGAQGRHAGVPATVATLIAAHALGMAALGVAWFVIGQGTMSGTFEPAWLVAWALALASTVPLGALTSWAQGRFAVTAGRLMKQRLLYGALRLDPDAMRRDGAGSMLGRVLESTAIESLFLGGSLASLLSLVDLAFAGWVLAEGAGGWLTVPLFLGYTVFAAFVVRALYRRTVAWTEDRLHMTHDLVERMVGHRTRLAQQAPARWHEDEDEMVEAYLARGAALDRSSLVFSLLPRGWLVLGALGMAPAFVGGTSPTAVAVAIGGLMLGYQALSALSGGLGSLAQAAVSWRQVRPLFEAGRDREAQGELEVRLAAAERDADKPVLEARDLSFRYPARERPVLERCSLSLLPQDRVLVEGASGSGKSTMASILGGLREPTAGLLLVDGLDIKSLGPEGWRARIATVPQFHENHVFSGTFAFNGLMGRSWPASPEDLAELEAVCGELGLGPLLERMPSGMQQSVGDHGWQLSHGERSRLFLARALCQREARVWIFDESFAALDPITLERCVQAVQERAHCLVVIAHP